MIESVTAYEGYFYGTVAAQAVNGAGSREAVPRRLQAGISLTGGTRIDFSKSKVGYRYLEFFHKSKIGRLVA